MSSTRTLGYAQFSAFGENQRSSGGYCRFVVDVINGSEARDREADAAQAEYFRRELSALRAQAQSDLARHYIELRKLRDSGLADRAAFVQRLIRALEHEVATLERLGQGLNRWL